MRIYTKNRRYPNSDFDQYQSWHGTETFDVVNCSIKKCPLLVITDFFFIQTPEIWGEIYPKNVWKWPKIITNMKWFKTFIFFYIVWNILFNFHHNTYQIYALMLMLLLDSRNSWWKYWKHLKHPKNQIAPMGQKKMLYRCWGTQNPWSHFCTNFV